MNETFKNGANVYIFFYLGCLLKVLFYTGQAEQERLKTINEISY